MTKVKLKDAIKDLTTDAAKVRDDASRVRQSADGLAKSLRALENGFIKSLNAKAEQEKRAEEEKRLSDHSKAYVMLDVDEQAAVNAARQEAEKAEKAERAENRIPVCDRCTTFWENSNPTPGKKQNKTKSLPAITLPDGSIIHLLILIPGDKP